MNRAGILTLVCLIALAISASKLWAASYLEAALLKERRALAFDLQGAPELIGQYGLSAHQVLTSLAPHLEACSVVIERSEASSDDSVHEVYALYLGAYRLAGAKLSLHHHKNRLVMLRAELPDYRLSSELPATDDFLPLSELGFGEDDGIIQKSEPVLADSSGLPAPAWSVTRYDQQTGQTERILVDAQTGAVISQETIAFHAGEVARLYARGPHEQALVDVPLPDLPGTGYLDGKHIVVFAPSEKDPRVQAPDGVFDFLPDDPADASYFDQVQTYHAATRALQWLQDRFGFDPGPVPVVVRIDTVVRGRTDNAQFVPPPQGPEIQIGKGNEHTRNLGRDSDVVIHEYGHFVLYRYIQSSSGESGIVHEGVADYLTYAINGDPFLGESVLAGKPFLRTGQLPATHRYDQTEDRSLPHVGGQLWSAVLWEIRAALGATADEIVYASFPYLGPTSGLRDALLGLLSADRDLHPLPSEDPEHGVYGRNKCLILNTALARGFGLYLDAFDGKSCGLNLAVLAEESKLISEGKDFATQGSFALKIGGRSCAVAPGLGNDGNAAASILIRVAVILALFLLPLACCILQTAFAPTPRLKTQASQGKKERHGS